MSLSINRVMIAGNLTRDVQVKFINDERAVANFGIAVNRKFKQGDELKEEVTYVDIECWGRTAELCGQYLAKGRPVYIDGRLKLDTWDDKTTGQKRSKLTVVADNVQFLGSGRPKGDDETQSLPPTAAAAAAREKAQGGGAGDEMPPFARSELELMP